RRAVPLAFAASLLVPGLTAPAPTFAADPPNVRDHRQTVTPIQVILKRVIVHDDMDWGNGEISIRYRVFSRESACPNDHGPGCGELLVDGYVPQFSATDGTVRQVDLAIPTASDAISGGAVSTNVGLPVDSTRWYGLRIDGLERDPAKDDQ